MRLDKVKVCKGGAQSGAQGALHRWRTQGGVGEESAAEWPRRQGGNSG